VKWHLSLYCAVHVEDDTRLYTNIFIVCLSCACVKSDWLIDYWWRGGWLCGRMSSWALLILWCKVPSLHITQNAWPAYSSSCHVNYTNATGASSPSSQIRISGVLRIVQQRENCSVCVCLWEKMQLQCTCKNHIFFF